jgi:hypothetical protein
MEKIFSELINISGSNLENINAAINKKAPKNIRGFLLFLKLLIEVILTSS